MAKVLQYNIEKKGPSPVFREGDTGAPYGLQPASSNRTSTYLTRPLQYC